MANQVFGVILAGGQASRMRYQSKPLLMLAGKSLIDHVIELARPQVEQLLISVNDQSEPYQSLGLPLVRDIAADKQGPLVGICSAMRWLQQHRPEQEGRNPAYLACFPADVPVFPGDLVTTLYQSLRNAQSAASPGSWNRDTVAWCQTGQQIQPLFSLWPLSSLPRLERAIEKGLHGPWLYFQNNPNLPVYLPDAVPPLFFNINTPEELAQAEQLIKGPG